MAPAVAHILPVYPPTLDRASTAMITRISALTIAALLLMLAVVQLTYLHATSPPMGDRSDMRMEDRSDMRMDLSAIGDMMRGKSGDGFEQLSDYPARSSSGPNTGVHTAVKESSHSAGERADSFLHEAAGLKDSDNSTAEPSNPQSPRDSDPSSGSSSAAISADGSSINGSVPTGMTAKMPPCPAYFSFIYDDLQPWRKRGGIHPMSLWNARVAGASFHVIIVSGHVYAEHFHPCYQTRALFTLWGILQLVRLFPGDIPDVHLMFNCQDEPLVRKATHSLSPHPPLRAAS